MREADLAKLSREHLVALVLEMAGQLDALRAQLDEQSRRGKRQAAPFSKGTRVASPKRPGRKPGQGQFRRREAPEPEQLTEPPIDVPVAEPACPACGGELAHERVDDASVVDLPEPIRPRVRAFRVAVCRCRRCGATARGRHPELAPDQRGATAHRLGPRLRAAAHHLHYGLGVPVRKLPAILELLAGVRLTQGALTHDALRRAEGPVGAEYEALRHGVRRAPYVHTDDTGWREGGDPAWLMTFETDTATVYQVRSRHRNEEVREVIPADYEGVMIADRGTSYDAQELAGVRQQKCLAHVLRSLSEVLAKMSGKARWFAAKLKALLREALALWRENRAGPAQDFAGRARRLKAAIAAHLRDRALSDPDNQRLLDGPGRCHDAGSLVRFLDEPTIEPTNNRAERALRPAVIARKVSQCTKNARGTVAFEAWTSVVRTLARTKGGPALLDAIAGLIQPVTPRPA
jgi:transposase